MRRWLTFVSVLLGGGGMLIMPAFADDLATCRDRGSAADEAIAACGRLLAASPAGAEPATALMGRANGYLAKRDYDRAIADYDMAISRDPGLVAAYGGRARARIAKGDLDAALADYDQALRLNPRATQFYVDRGNAWRRKGRIDRGIADFSEAIRLDPAFADALISRGLAYEHKAEREQARADYEAVLALTPRGEPGRRMQDIARARLTNLGASEPAPALQATRTSLPFPSPANTRVSSVAAPALQTAPGAQPPAAKPEAAPQIRAPATVTAAVPPAAAPAAASPRGGVDNGYRVALVIGNGAYVNASNLPNPPNDAHAVAKTLRDMGFDVIEGTDLDRTVMERMIRDFLRKAPNARVTVLFYAGHGMQVDGKNYLVPVDARLLAPSDLGFETIELDKILAGLDDAARANIIILDACRDNPLARSFASRIGASRSASVAGGLAGYSTIGTGTLIAFATAPGQTALDGREANSPFTAALIKYLRTPGMEVNQMLTRVRVEVAVSTANRQI
ncbi:MAG TPA: caspase family protein, partial [Xanthobacteraceae bacterium]|nr:caspase family protein [Xanthobacteraceae bacterium]